MATPLTSNSLLTTLEAFSEIACADGRVFGVETMCENCNIEFNECLRRRLYENLVANQGRVERTVGYNLTPRYHMQEIRWDGVPGRFQLDWPGIVEVAVSGVSVVIEEAVEVSPFVILDAPVSDSEAGYCLVELDSTYIDNPGYAVIRDATTNDIYDQQEVAGYPRRTPEGNWLVALAKPALPPCDDIEVNIQHCKLMAVEIETPECDGVIAIVRPGTDEVIPFAKDPTVNGDNTIYWVRPWSMVHGAFSDDVIDLAEQAQFYKLLDTVDFICESSGEAPTVVTQSNCHCIEGWQDTSDLIDVNVVFADRSIIQISYSSTATCLSRCGQPLKFKIYYKTDPSLVVGQDSLLALQEAIAYLTAAELPVSSCGCEVKEGFIAEAQKAYAEYRINPFNGQVVTNIKFNSLTGQLVFAEKLSKAYKFKRSTRF